MSEAVIERPPEPLVLIQQAIAQGFKAEDLKVLFDLHCQVNAERAREAFHRDLVIAQSQMPVVVRDGQNPQTRSAYARLETVQKACKPTWERHGFALSFAEDDCPLEGHKRTVCDVRHVGGHCVRYWIDLPVDGVGPKGNAIGGMNRLQGAISSGSYGQRVLTCRIFGIVIADSDDDGNGAAELDTLLRDEQLELAALIERKGADTQRFLRYAAQLQGKPVHDLEDILRANFAKLVEALNHKPDKEAR